ncbi:hypothetical protein FM996_21640 [Methylosinus sporium]|uniref:Uncharacterized protein n=1 Tax=Methylosinus sporium TaxID=428 RepID=A0A549SCF8_METSR|nr:hypothetical protein [Methylosinus sporium]TRL21539.1 hypothetical protein FM996_21640 [Methylosinus sporium]
MADDKFDLHSEFENLMRKAGVTRAHRLAVSNTNQGLDGHCTPWPRPWPIVITISQGALDAGADITRAVLAHEVAHTRQHYRWIIWAGVFPIMGVAWAFGEIWQGVAPAGIWMLAGIALYDIDADRWAADQVGAGDVARMLGMLDVTARWRASVVRRRSGVPR